MNTWKLGWNGIEEKMGHSIRVCRLFCDSRTLHKMLLLPKVMLSSKFLSVPDLTKAFSNSAFIFIPQVAAIYQAKKSMTWTKSLDLFEERKKCFQFSGIILVTLCCLFFHPLLSNFLDISHQAINGENGSENPPFIAGSTWDLPSSYTLFLLIKSFPHTYKSDTGFILQHLLFC